MQSFKLFPTRPTREDGDSGHLARYGSLTGEQLITNLHATQGGLQTEEVERRLQQYGLNALKTQPQTNVLQGGKPQMEPSEQVVPGMRPCFRRVV